MFRVVSNPVRASDKQMDIRGERLGSFLYLPYVASNLVVGHSQILHTWYAIT